MMNGPCIMALCTRDLAIPPVLSLSLSLFAELDASLSLVSCLSRQFQMPVQTALTDVRRGRLSCVVSSVDRGFCLQAIFVVS